MIFTLAVTDMPGRILPRNGLSAAKVSFTGIRCTTLVKLPVALSGGVFQNLLLLRLTLAGMRQQGLEVITHRRVPPNDGGIALGQLLVGNAG